MDKLHLETADNAFLLFSLGLLAQEPARTCTWPYHDVIISSHIAAMHLKCWLSGKQSDPRNPCRLLGTKEKKAQSLSVI